MIDLVVDLNGESGGSLSIFGRIHINHIFWFGDVGDKIFIIILLTYFVSDIVVARFFIILNPNHSFDKIVHAVNTVHCP